MNGWAVASICLARPYHFCVVYVVFRETTPRNPSGLALTETVSLDIFRQEPSRKNNGSRILHHHPARPLVTRHKQNVAIVVHLVSGFTGLSWLPGVPGDGSKGLQAVLSCRWTLDVGRTLTLSLACGWP